MAEVHEFREWKAADIVRHFKGTEYIIIGVGIEATNSETDGFKQKIIYKRLDGTGPIWVRDKEEFDSLVDTNKYPNTKQRYRFELVETHDKSNNM